MEIDMTKEEKIKAIYKNIADKTKNFGCKIERQGNYYIVIEGRHFIYEKTGKYLKTTSQSIEELSCESIGHPVMIGNILNYIENMELKFFDNLYIRDKVLYLYKNKTNTIEEQSSDCIDFVFNLLHKK